MNKAPILYSFRRCPYAMRARMALFISKTPVRLREVVLRDKPEEMIAVSPKATVPVLVDDSVDGDGVVDESLSIMHWALERSDPQNWLEDKEASAALIAEADSDFKDNLDRYKYPTRYENVDPIAHRSAGLEFLVKLDKCIAQQGQLLGKEPRLADYAIFPFIRQFANNDRNWFDAQPIAALQTWLAAHLDSDLFSAVMKKYPQWKTGDAEPMFAA
ncbi:glutathione S-transferase [Parasphingorhabdus sp. JC815]|uniref:glutathione S-transferase n=1 Tax=Parasphingorhabdus sp. JC815 TaxID=3232140 RepID=UPI003459DFE8